MGQEIKPQSDEVFPLILAEVDSSDVHTSLEYQWFVEQLSAEFLSTLFQFQRANSRQVKVSILAGGHTKKYSQCDTHLLAIPLCT